MWIIIGIIIGIGLLGLMQWLRNRNIVVSWYEWLIAAVGLFLLLFAVQNFAAALSELESAAAWKYILYMGVPSLILLVVAYVLIQRRQSSAG